MLDTIRVKWNTVLTREQLEYWTWKMTRTQKGERYHYLYNPKLDETTLRFTYYPVGYDKKPIFTLEASLPKLIFDNNYQMLGSIDGTVKIANMLLEDVPHIPKLDLAEGILIRLDMCYNYQVGDMVDDYINALGNLEYPHRRTKHHRFEGVEYRAKHKTTKFYNKERESGFIEARGILRQETTLLQGEYIQKFLGKPKPTLLDITYEQVALYLIEDLAKLGLLDNSIATRDTALIKLCQEHGSDAGFYYYGLLLSKIDKSKLEIRTTTKTHPRSLDRKLKKIKDTGIPLTLTNREEPLPPLSITL